MSSSWWASRFIRGHMGRALAAAVVVALVLSACGDDSDDADSTDESDATAVPTQSEPAATATAAAADAGEEGRVAQSGDTVQVHYRGTLDDGTEFDSSEGREPLTFTVGAGQVISGFDSAVVGMEVGEKKEVRLAPDEAYGERTDERIIQVPKEQAPEGLEAGQQVLLGQAPATVLEVTEEAVTVDANHPLAGEALNFEIELVAIQ